MRGPRRCRPSPTSTRSGASPPTRSSRSKNRLEAFEDIIDSEVGDTSLTRARNVEREFGIRQLYLKFDGGNPTGTQKDRIAFAQVEDALRRGFDVDHRGDLRQLRRRARARRLGRGPALRHLHARAASTPAASTRWRQRGAEIRASPTATTRPRSRRRAAGPADGESYDANPGGANTTLQLQAYGEIAYEIYDELRDAPAAVAVPVSNGTTLAGIHKGFVSLYRRGKTSRIPRMVAGSSSGKNPIVRSFAKGLEICEDLDPARLRETAINEPLINWHSVDGEHALDAHPRQRRLGRQRQRPRDAAPLQAAARDRRA